MVSRSGGAWGECDPHPNFFFGNPPIKTNAHHGAHPHLKKKHTPRPPLKREAPFHEMIPSKSTINNNLKSS